MLQILKISLNLLEVSFGIFKDVGLEGRIAQKWHDFRDLNQHKL
jgi:hypothetical protein